MKVNDIIRFLEAEAPASYQESYDNAGLITGTGQESVTGVLFSLDCTEEVVAEAAAKGCNLIVAHHPIVFKGLKRFNGKNYVERTIISAIKLDICIYAIHTNLDNVHTGVNAKIASKLGLSNTRIMVPKQDTLLKLTVFVPNENEQELLNALAEAGAGNIGNYKKCSFQLEGKGTFMPNEVAQPHIGEANKLETVAETRIEVLFPAHLKGQVLAAMNHAHPYEEVAYYLHKLENTNQEVGSGMVGELDAPMDPKAFLHHLKNAMNLNVIKHTNLNVKDQIKKVAICGGAGSFLLGAAKASGADIFITADYKYHEFFDAEERIIIADIGHYESEVFTKNLLHDWVSKRFPELNTVLCETNTNPVSYFV
ncbi:Nif3-like dinuclear metal center hexameric protein [Limibacter armeniacum]|uniref:Nif3-like dinuclear metal center hexameric protein n=1 Tax=Limibacter armeniacum TaxID=466084 RepID=UPI002FE5F197